MPEKEIDLSFTKIKVKPIWESTDGGQEAVTDEEIAAKFKTEKAQQTFFEVMLSSYRLSLLEEDLIGMLTRETATWFTWFGRIEPHFSDRGDGWNLLEDLKRDIEWVTNLAQDDAVKRIRYSFAMYRYHVSGERARREFATTAWVGSLSNRIFVSNVLARAKTLGTPPPIAPGVTRWTVTQAPITRWTITPPNMPPLRPGQIRVYTGQSIDTIFSFIEHGIELRPPTYPGRAQFGGGGYASPHRAVAEEYAEQHAVGLTLPLEVDIANLNVLNLVHQPGRQAFFDQYLGLRPQGSQLRLGDLWRHQYNRYEIFEAFMAGQVVGTDVVIAPHEAGIQVVFRSEAALHRLDQALRKYAARQ
jgi:hypothetical protein